jgi:hypothetical protein
VLVGCRGGEPRPGADAPKPEPQTVADPPVSASAAPASAAQPTEPPPPPPPLEWPPTTERTDLLRWCVVGHVSDEAGQPVAGVEIIAHCGWATLQGTGRALSDEAGDYVMWFGPGMYMLNENSGFQAATISAHKEGLIERNLYRQGDLRMANRPPDETELRHWDRPEDIVYPDQPPRRLDFVMVPAAMVWGRLVDEAGQPIVDHYVVLDADELPPSSSALAAMKTDEFGRFRFPEVPADVWLSIRTPEDRMHEVCSEHLHCTPKQVYEVELVYHPGPPPSLTESVVMR